jgi:hypothetical protein
VSLSKIAYFFIVIMLHCRTQCRGCLCFCMQLLCFIIDCWKFKRVFVLGRPPTKLCTYQILLNSVTKFQSWIGCTLTQSMVIVQMFFSFILEGSLRCIYETNSGNASPHIRFISLSAICNFKEWHLTLSKHRNILKKTQSCGLCHIILKVTAWCTYDT